MDVHPSVGLLYLASHMFAHGKIYHSRGRTFSSYKRFTSSDIPSESYHHFHFNLQLSNAASLWYMSLFICIFATGILEMRWSGVAIDDWWRNEQFWVIGGVSAHLFAIFQGLLKVLAGVDTSFTVTSKGGDDEEFSELYTFKWTTLLIVPTTLLLLNFIGVVAGISNAINKGYESWGPLLGKLFFAFWVIIRLHPFLKGLVGRQNRMPTMVIVCSIVLA